MSLSPARRRNRIARQDRYCAEGTALPQKTTDAIKRLKDEATHNDLAEEARPGDAAWVKAICDMSLCTAVIIRWSEKVMHCDSTFYETCLLAQNC